MNVNTEQQAYQQAPWRRQLQWIGGFMVIVVIVSAVAGLYLSVSGKAAVAGRRIQKLEMKARTLQLEINDLNTYLAKISSSQALNERVGDLNMRTVNPHEAIYLEVPGYHPDLREREEAPAVVEEIKPSLLPEYTISLWDWLREKIWTIKPFDTTQNQSGEVLP